jgi:hypothetical protein
MPADALYGAPHCASLLARMPDIPLLEGAAGNILVG